MFYYCCFLKFVSLQITYKNASWKKTMGGRLFLHFEDEIHSFNERFLTWFNMFNFNHISLTIGVTYVINRHRGYIGYPLWKGSQDHLLFQIYSSKKVQNSNTETQSMYLVLNYFSKVYHIITWSMVTWCDILWNKNRLFEFIFYTFRLGRNFVHSFHISLASSSLMSRLQLSVCLVPPSTTISDLDMPKNINK